MSLTPWADTLFERIAAWAAPTLNYDSRVSKDWPMMRTDYALAGTAFYLVIVAVGLVMRPSNWRSLPQAREGGAKGASLAVMWRQDKVRVAQIVYNIVQVCGGRERCDCYGPRRRVRVVLVWQPRRSCFRRSGPVFRDSPCCVGIPAWLAAADCPLLLHGN